MFVTVLVRRLKPGKTEDDFLRAWYPDKGFGFPGQGPFLARNINQAGEILTVLSTSRTVSLDRELARVGRQEAIRHDRIANVIEATTYRGVFEMMHAFDFSTDETVARGRTSWLSTQR
jgi:hypothetical protein